MTEKSEAGHENIAHVAIRSWLLENIVTQCSPTILSALGMCNVIVFKGHGGALAG